MKKLLDTFIKPTRDAAYAKLAEVLAQQLGFDRYGTVQVRALDTNAKEISIALILKGEDTPITSLIRYRLDHADGKSILFLEGITASREWMNLLIEDFIAKEKRSVVLPSGVGWIVRVLGL